MSADPFLVACDILGQAEHDPNSGQLLVCLSEAFARETLDELHKQLAVLPTKDVAEISWGDNGKLYVADDRDEGAPEFPLILAIDWPDRATVDAFLAHPIRKEGRAATEGVLSRFFTGRIHHHVTTAHSFDPT